MCSKETTSRQKKEVLVEVLKINNVLMGVRWVV
jgi:hypothetical protein